MYQNFKRQTIMSDEKNEIYSDFNSVGIYIKTEQTKINCTWQIHYGGYWNGREDPETEGIDLKTPENSAEESRAELVFMAQPLPRPTIPTVEGLNKTIFLYVCLRSNSKISVLNIQVGKMKPRKVFGSGQGPPGNVF